MIDVKCDHREDYAWPGVASVAKHHRHHHFQVRSPHSHKHGCYKFLEPKILKKDSCLFREIGYTERSREIDSDPAVKVKKYDNCAHWFWQTEASAHLWLPEIYESFSQTIIVTRLFHVSELDKFVGNDVQKKQYEAVQHLQAARSESKERLRLPTCS